MNFMEKWNNHQFENCVSFMGEDSYEFFKDFSSYLSNQFAKLGADLADFNTSHYYCSGFIKKQDKFVYFSLDLPRYEGEKLRITDAKVLYRTAQSTRDFSGGNNNYTSLEQLCKNIDRLLERQLSV